jgi:hypothetical protein
VSHPGPTEISSLVEAEAALARWNGLRESFIKRLELLSHDEFEAPGTQNCTGRLDLVLVFMHHNFGEGGRIHEITATFRQVSDLRMDVSGQAFEWHVSALHISEGARAAELGREQPCLVAEIVSPRRAAGLRPVSSVLFRFAGARMTERPAE